MPGHEAPPPGGRAGSWPQTGVRRHPAGRKACGTGHSGVPGSGRVPCPPRRGVFQSGPHRRRREGVHVPGGQGLPQPLCERRCADGKTAPDAGHAVKLGQGAQNHQVGKEGRFTEQRFRSLCVIHERFINDPDDFRAALNGSCAGASAVQQGHRTDWRDSARKTALPSAACSARRRRDGRKEFRSSVRMERTSVPWRRAGQPVFGKSGFRNDGLFQV